MSRRTIPIDKTKLCGIIQELENTQTFLNRSSLFQSVVSTYNKDNSDSLLTVPVLYLRLKEWGTPLKTPKGKKGRQKGEIINPVGRITRNEKFSQNGTTKTALAKMLKVLPERFLPVGKKVIRGSLTAAVRLKCLDCSDYETTEVRKCECYECSLWAFRPYQGKI
jgi:hypothetical protein